MTDKPNRPRVSWIHRIRNFERLETAFHNLKQTYEAAKDANTRKKTQLSQQTHAVERANAELKEQKKVNRYLLEQNGLLMTQLFNYMKEPERKGSCVKPRIDTDVAAKILRERAAQHLGKPMWYYHCRICPPSPLSGQRYYHLTSKDREDNCG